MSGARPRTEVIWFSPSIGFSLGMLPTQVIASPTIRPTRWPSVTAIPPSTAYSDPGCVPSGANLSAVNAGRVPTGAALALGAGTTAEALTGTAAGGGSLSTGGVRRQ